MQEAEVVDLALFRQKRAGKQAREVEGHHMTPSMHPTGQLILTCECGWRAGSTDQQWLADTALHHLAAEITAQYGLGDSKS